MELDKEFWTKRYVEGTTGWDIGYVSTPIKEYFDQITDKDLRILIPGAGNAYEGEYLWKSGFKNVFILDLSENPLMEFKKRVPGFPESQLINANFFDLQEQFDLVVEQTFFCALNPQLRSAYVKKMSEILVPGGKIIGLLFDFPLTEEGPPFGGSKEEYMELFAPMFTIEILEKSHNSIGPRMGKEFFIRMSKKQ